MAQATVLKYQIKMQNFAWGLRQQMGYPLFAPANDCTAFAGGGLADFAKGMEVACLATQMRKDIVYLGWTDPADAAPTTFAVAIREMLQVDWLDRMVPWAADDISPILLVSIQHDEHVVVGSRGLLERPTGKPAKELGKGRKLAMQRIRRAAATMGDHLAANNVLLAPGEAWREPSTPSGDAVVRFA